MPAIRHGLLLSLFTIGGLLSPNAHAYCVLHTCKDVTEADVEADHTLEVKECERVDGCITEGFPLHYDSGCLSFGVSSLNASSLGLSDDEFLDIITQAFAVWESVDCGDGKPPGFLAQSVGVVDVNGNFFCKPEPLANISVWSLVTRWTRAGNALGYTSSTHNTKNGEIFDADVEINLNKVKQEHDPADWATVLGRIAVHEAGHFLGLAHSTNEEAVMYESYSAAELYTRVLAQDDVDGICALYPPNDGLKCSAPSYVEAGLDEQACLDAAAAPPAAAGGCSIQGAQPSSGAPWGGWASAGLAGALALMRRWQPKRRPMQSKASG